MSKNNCNTLKKTSNNLLKKTSVTKHGQKIIKTLK